jgi:hypothetical protein
MKEKTEGYQELTLRNFEKFKRGANEALRKYCAENRLWLFESKSKKGNKLIKY